jgi:hypothetical protein
MSIAATAGMFDELCDPTRERSLRDDQRGAIMVIGVFMAMLVVGFLYYIVGIGNTIIFRERLQDAADAVAFSGAVVHARGMNIIAMINIVLLVLMTVYMALKLVHQAIFAAVVVCGIFLCPLLPALETAERFFDNLVRVYSRTILQPALQIGHTAQEAVRTSFPLVAQARAIATAVSGTYSPPATGGLLLPVGRTLPVTPVKLDEQPRRPYPESPGGLCRRAADQISSALTIPLSIGILNPIRGPVASMLSRIIVMTTCPDDRPSLRNYDLDIGSGNCTDGMPGQQCEYTQLRGVVMASSTPFARNVQGVNVATLGRGGGGGGPFASFETLARFGFAQAEYYYDGTEDRDQWLWHMYWRARFRRVQLASVASSIPGVGAVLGVVDRIIVH